MIRILLAASATLSVAGMLAAFSTAPILTDAAPSLLTCSAICLAGAGIWWLVTS